MQSHRAAKEFSQRESNENRVFDIEFRDGFFFLKKHTAGRKIQTQIRRDSAGVSTLPKKTENYLCFQLKLQNASPISALYI